MNQKLDAHEIKKILTADPHASALIADISREMRDPMGVIMGFLELLKSNKLSEVDRKEAIDKITKSSKVMIKLIDEITEFSDIESNLLKINFQKVDLDFFIKQIYSSLEEKAKTKNLRFQLKTKDLPKYIYTDPEKLKEVLVNIIDNAVKYTKRGHIIIHIVGKIRDFNSTIEFNIIDSGIGIPLDDQNKIFHKFDEESRDKNTKGIGLSLFLSKKIIQSLNGSLELVKSMQGKGSTFRIQIHSHIPSKNQFVAKEYILDPSKEDQPLDGYTILIVDDSYDNCIYLRKILNALGANVAVAYEGRRGAERALKGSFDVVLMDIQMPNTDGFGALKILQEQEYKQPVIALTASATNADHEKCIDAGFNGFLTKPINIPILINSILNASSHKQ